MKSRYARLLKHSISDDEISRILSIFNRLGIENWLAENPFHQIEVSEVVMLNGREVNGWYSYRDKSTHIAFLRTNETFGAELEWGRTFALSDVAKTAFEAVQKTLVHELGHHLHQKLSEVDFFRFQLTFKVIRSNAASVYAKTRFNPEEYFAETFVAWVFHRTDLFIFDELGYAMIQAALQVIGVEVHEL